MALSFVFGGPLVLSGTRSSETEAWQPIGPFSAQEGTFALSLAPRSVTTYVGRATSTGRQVFLPITRR